MMNIIFATTTMLVSGIVPADLRVYPQGYTSLNATYLSDIWADDARVKLGQNSLSYQRWHFTPSLDVGGVLNMDTDLQLWADAPYVDTPKPAFAGYGLPRDKYAQTTTDDLRDLRGMHLRKFYLQLRTPVALFSLGRTPVQWGYGLVDNDGDAIHQDWGAPRFGRDYNYGDVANRLMISTLVDQCGEAPEWLRFWQLSLGADAMERDERMERPQGDNVYRGFGMLRYAREASKGGVYVFYRHVHDRSGGNERVWYYDAHVEHGWAVGPLRLVAGAEAVMAEGKTTQLANSAILKKQKILQFGGVGRVGASYPTSIQDTALVVGIDVEGGFASGDRNPFDRQARAFAMDPDYNPSLLLFDEVRAVQTAAAAARLSNPQEFGQSPTNARFIPSLGAVTNVGYVRPTVRINVGDWRLRVAMLWAEAVQPVVDYYYTTQRNVPTNEIGGPSRKRHLGLEVDVGVDYRLAIIEGFEIFPGVQGGRLFPGEAFENSAGQRHPAVQAIFAKLTVRAKG